MYKILENFLCWFSKITLGKGSFSLLVSERMASLMLLNISWSFKGIQMRIQLKNNIIFKIDFNYLLCICICVLQFIIKKNMLKFIPMLVFCSMKELVFHQIQNSQISFELTDQGKVQMTGSHRKTKKFWMSVLALKVELRTVTKESDFWSVSFLRMKEEIKPIVWLQSTSHFLWRIIGAPPTGHSTTVTIYKEKLQWFNFKLVRIC